MATLQSSKNKEVHDKQNPPHPTFSLKKLNSMQEPQTKKTVLGDSSHITIVEQDTEADSLGARLMARKRQNQKQSKSSQQFVLKPIQC